MDYDITLQILGEEEEQLRAELRKVDEEIAALEADLPKTRTTFDAHQESLMVPYSDPATLPKRRTTFDAAVEALTQEYKPS